VIVGGRRIHYGSIDPVMSRHLLIEQGLVDGSIEPKPAFLVRNEALVEELERLQSKLRRRDLLVSDAVRYEFYDRRVPDDVYDGATLNQWLKNHPHALAMTEANLLRDEVDDRCKEEFPDTLNIGRLELPLNYQYEPGAEQDGVTLNVPLEALNQVTPEPLGWLVPGRVEEKVVALIRALPKALRTQFVPAPEAAKQVVGMLRFGEGDIRASVAAALSQLGGVRIPPDAFQEDRLPAELRMNVRVTDAEGGLLVAGRDLAAIREQLGVQAAEVFSQVDDPHWTRDGLTDWDFDRLPAELELARGRLSVRAYPALLDRGESVSLRLVDSLQRAEQETRLGLRRLCVLAAGRELKSQIAWLPNLAKIEACAATIPGFELRGQLIDLLAERAMLADQPVPRTKEEFGQLLAAGRERIGWAVQELTSVVGPIFEGYRQATLAVDQLCNSAGQTKMPVLHLGTSGSTGGRKKAVREPVSLLPATSRGNRSGAASPGSPRWQYAVDDIRAQIARLMEPKEFSQTPWDWLRRYPQYFRAICSRLENLPGNVPRDQQSFEAFESRWLLYQERAEHHQAQGIVDPELIQFRWMLEEYRISLFAQKLGTAIPISPKRLDQQWAKVQA
jgi:ATP-dependent helicase HrpA